MSGSPLPARRGTETTAAPHLRLVTGRARPGPATRRDGSAPPARRDRVSSRAAIITLVGALCAIGMVMVLSASAYPSSVIYGSVWTIFERQALWMGVGLIVFFGATHLDYVKWRRLRVLLPAVTYLCLAAVLVPGVGVNVSGSSRWIGFGQLRLQPSELMKFAIAIFGADLLARRAAQAHRARAVVAPLLLALGLGAGLLLAQPDMGTAIVLCCIGFTLLFAGGVPLRPIAKAVGAAAVLAVILAIAEPYRRDRLLSFLNPFAHAKNSGYQVVQSLVGLGSGGVFGLGLGAGRQKWGFLPNAHTDFIFSVIGEETGLVGTLLVLALFAALAAFGLRVARRAPDRFGGLLAAAITCWITCQAVINIGAVIGVLPVTGIPLPFVSFGGSSLVITMAAAGVLANIAAHERAAERREPRRRAAAVT